MANQNQTTVLRRLLSLLLAVLLTVSGTGLTSFAAAADLDTPSETAWEEEILPAKAPEEESDEKSEGEPPAAPADEGTETDPAEQPAEQQEVVPDPEPSQEPTEEPSGEEPSPEEPSAEEPSDELPPMEVPGEVEVEFHSHLVERAASANEPLLADQALSAETRALLRTAGGPRKAGALNQTPVTADGMTIEKVTIRWVSRSTGESEPAGFGDLKLVTETKDVANQQFQIDFALSGKDVHEAGSVEIVFPAYLWLDRYGNEPGELTLSVPEDPELGADFAWKRVGDSIILTNTHKLSAATKVMIQGTFRKVSAPNMVDGTVSRNFAATLNLEVPNGQIITMNSNAIKATLDTKIVAASAVKNAYNSTSREYYVYHSVPSLLPAELRPENPDDYIYVRWYVSGSATGSQPFTMTFSDTAEERYGCIMLGATDTPSGVVKSSDHKNVSFQLFEGYDTNPKTAYVWTAYPKEGFPGEQGSTVLVRNEMTITVTGKDDHVSTTKTAEATAPVRVPYVYHVEKVWDDNNDANGHRPAKQTIRITQDGSGWRTVDLTEENSWKYTWTDDGKERKYEVYEQNMASGVASEYDDNEGVHHTVIWKYTQTGKNYDAVTRTWVFTNTYSEREPVVYHVTKVWDDNNNAAGHRPGYQSVRIYQDGSSWKTVSLNDANNWTYTWDDGGLDHTYSVSEESLASGITDYTYDEDLTRHWTRWNYSQTGREWDPVTRTWKFTNTYYERRYTEAVQYFNGGDTSTPIRGSASISKSCSEYQNKIQKATTDRVLNLLRVGKSAEINYTVRGTAYIMEWTRDESRSTADRAGYGQRDVVVELEDYQVVFDSRNLTKDDYEIASVTLNAPIRYTYGQKDIYSSWQYSSATDDSIAVALLGFRNGSWVKYATRQNGVVTAQNGARVTGGSTVILPYNVERVKTQAITKADGIQMSYGVSVRLKGSENIQDLLEAKFALEDYGMSTVTNSARINVIDDQGKTVKTGTSYASAWLHGRNHRVAAYLTKAFTTGTPDLVGRRVTMHTKAVMTQQSNILDLEEYNEAVENGNIPDATSGTWYDLLPEGMQVDISSVKLSSGDSIRDVYTIEDYRGSGRTLLVVKADFARHLSYVNSSTTTPFANDDAFPRDGYRNVQTLEFDSYISWDIILKAGGHSVRNVVAFESDGETLGNAAGWKGEPDDPDYNNNKRSRNAVGEDLALMTDLDPSRDDPSFVYASGLASFDDVDIMAVTSIQKQVTVDGSGVWSSGLNGEAVVYEGGRYTYRLLVTNDEAPSKDLIILDSLENFDPEDGGEHFHGKFVSIDVSQMRSAGIRPVVYYSTRAHMTFNAQDFESTEALKAYLNDTSVWSTTPPADPSTVHAIAIDCTTKTDGTPFQLEQNDRIYAYVHMQAPLQEETDEALFAEEAEDAMDSDNNAHAFNNGYLNLTQMDVAGRETYLGLVHIDYTQVGILPFSLHVTKLWNDSEDNDGKRPDSITVHLYANGKDTGRAITMTPDEDGNWKGVFEHVNMYDENNNHVTYSFAEDNCPGYTMSFARSDDQVTIVNTHELERVDLPFTKTWDNSGSAEAEELQPDAITVRLMADGVFTGQTLTIREDRYGEWKGEFTGLLKYNHGQIVNYTVEEEEIYKFAVSYNGTDITNKFYPYGDLEITKTVKNATETAVGQAFDFTLLLHDEDGNELTEKYAYQRTNVETGEVIESGTIGNGGAFQLKDGEKMTVKDIPSECAYEVQEAETDGFTLTGHANDSGYVRASKPRDIRFENTYHANGSVQLVAYKELTGRTIAQNQFRFEVWDENGDAIRNAANRADGTVPFAAIKYTEADDGVEFTYTIHELDRGRGGYTYDTDTVYTVKVTPHDKGNGTMTCVAEYYDADNNRVLMPAFHNEYHAEGDLSLRAWKTLSGRELEADEFTFRLMDATGAVIGTTTNNENGEVVWDAIHFTEADAGKTYLYVAAEVTGEDETVVYDKTLKGYEVTVVDNGDGTLSFTQSNVNVQETRAVGYEKAEGEADLPVFQNVLERGTLSVTKYTTRQDGGTPDTETRFKFQVRLIGEGLEDEQIRYELDKVPNAAGGQSNPTGGSTPAPGSIVPTTTSVTARGTMSSSVKWTLYADGTLIVEPTNGVSGTFARGTRSRDYGDDWSWYPYRASIKRAAFKGTCHLTGDALFMFYEWTNLEQIDLSGLETGVVTYFGGMFWQCWKLESLDLSCLDVHSATTGFTHMFYNLTGLKTLDISSFNTRAIGGMKGTLNTIPNLERVNLGPDFQFGESTFLPSGSWYLAGSSPKMIKTSEQLHDTYNSSLAGTWIRQGYSYAYTIAFDPNGGTGNMETIDAMIGQPVTLPACDFQNDSAFLGWSLTADAVTPTYEDRAQVSDLTAEAESTVTLYAVWGTPTKYTITYSAPAGAGGSMTPRYCEVDQPATLDDNLFYIYDHHFVHWVDENGVEYDANAVIPAGSYVPGDKLNLTAVFQREEHNADFRDGIFAFELAGGEKLTIPDLPAGTSYQVWEETSGGWVLVSEQNSSGSIEPLETAEAKFTNQYTPGTVTATIVGSKTLDGNGAQAEAFTFQLMDENGDVVDTVKNKSGGFIQFKTLTYTAAGTHTYTVREVPGGSSAIDYDGHAETVTVTVEDNGSGTLTAHVAYENGSIVFQNATRPGDLVINKAISGPDWADRNVTFTYQVKLTGANGVPLESRTVTGTVDTPATISGLPAGTRYEVEETDLPDGWQLDHISGAIGTVSAGSTAVVTVTNSYSAEGIATILAHKTLVGGDLRTGDFSFLLLDSAGNTVDTVTNSAVDTAEQIAGEDDEPVTNPWYGTAPARFDDLTFTAPGTYTYTVKEQRGDDPVVIYDTHTETVKVVVTDNGNGTLDTEVQYDEDGLLFTNELKKGGCTVSKTVQNGTEAALAQSFTFKVELLDAAGDPLAGTYPVIKSDGTETTVQNGGTVQIKADETFTVSELPHGCRYTVTEEAIDGFELTGIANGTGTVDAVNGNPEAAFTNAYSTKGSVTLNAHKTLVGDDLEADQFRFRIMNTDGQTLATAAADENGEIRFTLDYTGRDDGRTYTYYITEMEGDDDRISWDTHAEEVTVKVADNGDGTMTATERYASAEGARFTNYRLYALSISKQVAGNMGDRAEDFAFTIKLTKNGKAYTEPVTVPEETDSWTAGESGTYTFTLRHGESFTILLPVDVTYEITEHVPEDYTVTVACRDSDGNELENRAEAPTAKGVVTRETGDHSVAYTNTRNGVIPTGADLPAMAALAGMSAAAVTGLTVLHGRRRKKRNA